MKFLDVGLFWHGDSSYLLKGTRRFLLGLLRPLMFSCMTDSLPWLTPLPSVEKEQKEVPAPASPAVPVPTRSLARPAGKERKRNLLTEAAEQTEAFQLEVPPELALLREIAEQEGAVLGDRDFVMLTSSTLLSPMEKDERILRTTFVQEYLFDFDPIAAACRCGYKDERVGLAPSDAELAARKLMAEPVVRRLIKEYALPQAQELNPAQARFLVMREAANHGATGSPAARQASQRLLLEMSKGGGEQDDGKVKGGIMAVPARFASDSAWEKNALESQKQLKESVGA